MSTQLTILKKKVAKIMEESNHEYHLHPGYSGRGMCGRTSVFAFSTDERPTSDIGVKLIKAGLGYDSLGHSFIYFSRAMTGVETLPSSSGSSAAES